LVGYAAANFSTFRTDEARLAWLHARLARTVGKLPDASAATNVHRSEVMMLVNDVEAALTRSE